MAFFGSDWLEDYDSIDEYEFHIGGSKDDIQYEYDKPVCPPIHIEDGHDSLTEYESGIKHFKD